MRYPTVRKYKPPWQRPNWKRSTSPDYDLEYSSDVSQTSSSDDDGHVEDDCMPEEEEAAEEAYDYPIPAGHGDIRVLRLLPGKDTDPIRVELHLKAMSTNPEYMAISYAWGDRNAQRTVICEDKDIQVPMSLHRALAHLRHSVDAVDLWADAISINQEDEVEKGCQVQQMRTIFMKAKKVIVWLGPDNRQVAKSVLQTLDAMAKQEFETAPAPEDLFWRDAERLFRRHWFRRLWCLQEIVLAAEAEILWGMERVPWKTVAETATWVHSCPVQLFQNMAQSGVNNAHTMHMLAEGLKQGKHTSFLELLALAWQFKSTDSRDSVYGIQGIPTTDTDPSLGNLLVLPDYTKEVADVHLDCATQIVQRTRSLRLLSHVQAWKESRYDTATNSLPSWVPRWNKYILPMLVPSEQISCFNASVHLPALPPLIEQCTLLTKGLKVSPIKHASTTWNLNHGSRKISWLIKEAWEDQMRFSVSPKDENDRLKVLCLVLTAGKDWNGVPVDDIQQHVADFWAYLCKEKISDVEGLSMAPRAEGGDSYRFYLALRNACQERSLFYTESGLCGLGPPSIGGDEGDIVSILCGSHMPIILRPVENGYKVIGEAYVHGIMYGEASRDDMELEDFAMN
ncbi:heterokaryon incompatibility protein-domain-containing protein [Pestalotiopsis sp. NC0098]|nr:heterokaryon incompatibility protein-domain-containing protein [Pestalotiopsis sp. NC0098]